MKLKKFSLYLSLCFTRFKRDDIGPSGLCRRFFDGEILFGGFVNGETCFGSFADGKKCVGGFADEEPHEVFTERTSEYHPSVEAKTQLSVYVVSDVVQNPTTTTSANNDDINNSPRERLLSSLIDPDIQAHFSSIKEVNFETSTSALSNENSLYSINIEHKMIRSRNQVSSTKPPNHVSPSTKPSNHISPSTKPPT
ncbi:unnamed protein product, partial [Rotaria sp. Silwood2]